ncbi:MAG: archaellum component FlaG (FlaF/FlaG flagellin family) [Candidatus Poseidoniaceae archaeon]|jgi:archaellum component FlaG (FlaF/FlaG flagellin family)|tara:strand:+ start:21 stop:524 length:504 start_codon:yes stop_codon:yes gene_type:complete
MADGGASTIIMLVTALLISSAASAVLVQEWSSTTRAIQYQQKGLELSAEIGIDFAGDPMMVSITTGPPNVIIFYIQNTGSHPMDATSLAVLVDGVSIPNPSITTAFVPIASAQWNPNVLLEVTLTDNALNALNDDDEISIYATARSVVVSGISMSVSLNEEVQLHES